MKGKAPLAIEAPPPKKARAEPAPSEERPAERPAERALVPVAAAQASGGAGQPRAAQDDAVAVPITAGKGRGLKSVQVAKELAMNVERKDGSFTESKQKIKEQKITTAKGNAHVETKVMTEDNRRTITRNGTVV